MNLAGFLNSAVQILFWWAICTLIILFSMKLTLTWQHWTFVGGELIIVWVFFIILSRIIFSTKTIYFVYWLLRTLHLRKKAKATMVIEGQKVHIHIDKLDPGEQVEQKMFLQVNPKKGKKK